jgi:hypothetical protein
MIPPFRAIACAAASSIFPPLFVLAGCATQAIDDRADEQLAELRADAEHAAAYTTCPQGRLLGPNCGLLTKWFADDQVRERFRAAHCQRRTADECQDRYERMLSAQLEKRYFAADFSAAGRECDADPGRCDDIVGYERLLVESHNARVREWAVQRETRIESERREAKRQHGELVARGVGEVFYFIHDGPKCRSFPSVFEGVTNTTCSGSASR